MNYNTDRLIDVLSGEKGKEILGLGAKIKKLDRDNDRRMTLIILLSVISMTVLGYIALGAFGGIIFFAITVISSFWLYYSSKKNVLLKYLTFYRSRVPRLIAEAEGIEVKAEEIPDREFVRTLYGTDKVEYRMSHNYDGLYMAYAKFINGSDIAVQGLLCYTEGEVELTDGKRELLENEFGDVIFKCENGKSLMFIPGADTYLNGRVEMKNDLDTEALTEQYRYYLTAKEWKM